MPTVNRVLVIDDEPALRRLIDLMLTREGYIVVSIDGQAIMSIIENDQDFSLVITDLLMPKIDGLKVLQYVREHCPNVPVIISSAVRDPELVRQLLAQGATAFLPRPFAHAQLIDLVRKVVKQ